MNIVQKTTRYVKMEAGLMISGAANVLAKRTRYLGLSVSMHPTQFIQFQAYIYREADTI